jgi:hypothetical protein
MASVESNKKVARAAKAGGGRSRAQTSTSWGYIGALIGIAAVGFGLIGLSWAQTQEDPNAPYLQTQGRAADERKRLDDVLKKYKDKPDAPQVKAAQKRYEDYITNNHVHAAYGIYDCTADKGSEWLPPLSGVLNELNAEGQFIGDPDPKGIHAHDDGLIHVHPFSKNATGRRAQMQKWLDSTGIKVGEEQIFLPGKGPSGVLAVTQDRTLNAGKKCKNGKESVIRIFEYKDALKGGQENKDAKAVRIAGNIGEIRLRANYAYVFARVDKDFEPPLPPSVAALVAPSDQIQSSGGAATPAAPATPEASIVVGSSVAGSSVAATSVAATSVKSSPSTTPPTTKK